MTSYKPHFLPDFFFFSINNHIYKSINTSYILYKTHCFSHYLLFTALAFDFFALDPPPKNPANISEKSGKLDLSFKAFI